MISYPISSDLHKKISLQCYQLYNLPCFRSSHWKCAGRKGVLRNFPKSTGKHLWQRLFFNEVAGLRRLLLIFLFSLEDFLFIST